MPKTTDTAATPDGTCAVRLFTPDGPGRWPGVVMFPDAGGVRDAVRPVRSSEVIWLAFGCCGGRTPPAGSVGSAPAPYATRMLAKSNPTKPPVVVVLSRLP